jgi:hypothetical protein
LCRICANSAPYKELKWLHNIEYKIYVGFDSPSIIRFLEPLTNDVFKACFEHYHFDENIFPSLGKEKLLPEARQ